jgi:Galactose oxidase-like, Early set domain
MIRASLRTMLLVAVLPLAGAAYADEPKATASAPASSGADTLYGNTDPRLYGRWETVIPKLGGAAIGKVLGMQTVHTVVLPSGKVLFASGSSWRNHAPVESYPRNRNPKPGSGVFNRDTDPFQDSKLKSYYEIVNNVAVYDPEENTFYRIPHPVPVSDAYNARHFAPNDLFCTGHLHLPNGNVLFVGGTQYYAPFRTGNNSTYIFDWKKELTIHWASVDWRKIPQPKADPWVFSGFMQRGRWYASIVPLLDGRMTVFGGFVGFDHGYPNMYNFEMNSLVEFFDPSKFDPKNPAPAWKSVDVSRLTDSPYATLINPKFKPTPHVPCDSRCMAGNRYDAFKLYPENYLMPDGRIFLTREGDWVSPRTCDAAFMRRTNHTYWVTVGGSSATPKVTFARGPDRPEEISSYGTSLFDPNSGMISILGGQPTSAGTFFSANSVPTAQIANNCVNAPSPPPVTQFAGGRGSRKIETFHVAAAEPGGGHWTLDPNFLGDAPQDDRTMHYAITLPTRQVLIINGGNYDFYGPVRYPIMLTPIFENKVFKGYDKVRMSEGVEPRLYHNAAVLLPDGRVLVSGGNTTRAMFHGDVRPKPDDPKRRGQPLPDLNQVDLDRYFFADGPQGKGVKGMLTTPSEDWVAEIFSPPYLFIDPGRRPAITSIDPVGSAASSYEYKAQVGGKTFFLLHSDGNYNVTLDGLPAPCSDGNGSLVLIKLPSATHGWQNGQHFVDLPFRAGSDRRQIQFTAPNAKTANIPPAFYMMFYVDCKGKPSVARMVRFDDGAEKI